MSEGHVISRWIRGAGLVAASLTLGACGILGSAGDLDLGFGMGDGRVRVENAALGSGLEDHLRRSTLRQMETAMAAVFSSEQEGATAPWGIDPDNPATVRGAVRAGEPFLIGIDGAFGERLNAPLGLDTSFVLEPDTTTVRTKVNSNVRLGPDQSYERVTTVDAGTILQVRGQVQDSDWALVSIGRVRSERVLGYIYRPLVKRVGTGGPSAPGDDTLVGDEIQGGEPFSLDGEEAFDIDEALAGGGATSQPRLCRDFEQKIISITGQSREWSGMACRVSPTRWRVERDVLAVGNGS